MPRKVQLSFALIIAILFLVGLIIPYGTWNDFDAENLTNHLKTLHGWRVLSFQILFVLSAIVIGISFSPYIAVRLFIIRIALVLFLPAIFVALIFDFAADTFYGSLGEVHYGLYLNYSATFLTIIYSIIHFFTSYPKYRRMLKQQEREEADLLDF